jgi:hypothetical protein
MYQEKSGNPEIELKAIIRSLILGIGGRQLAVLVAHPSGSGSVAAHASGGLTESK